MEYISLIMNEDAAHDCLADLGKMGVIQFTDVRTNQIKTKPSCSIVYRGTSTLVCLFVSFFTSPKNKKNISW